MGDNEGMHHERRWKEYKDEEREIKTERWEFSIEEQARLSAVLQRSLGPELLSTRPANGGMGRVPYLEGSKAIRLANEIFGFNGWSSSIRELRSNLVERDPQTGKFMVSFTVILRVTLKDGTFHEDVGHGSAENAKSLAAGIEKAQKEATTDALKRALRNFGNALGNCLYDKMYSQHVLRIQCPKPFFDPESLIRADSTDHKRSYVPSPIQDARLERVSKMQATERSRSAVTITSSSRLSEGKHGAADEFAIFDDDVDGLLDDDFDKVDIEIQTLSSNSKSVAIAKDEPLSTTAPTPPPMAIILGPQMSDIQTPKDKHSADSHVPAFLNARAANVLNEGKNINVAKVAFNPHLDSPSIPKSKGIDHTKSSPVPRKSMENTPPPVHHHNTRRQVGMPPLMPTARSGK